MPRRIQEKELQAIEAALAQHVEGLTAQQIHDVLAAPPPRRTLQYRLKHLMDRKRLRREGAGRWARYLPPGPAAVGTAASSAAASNEVRRSGTPPRSAAAQRIRNYVGQPLELRPAVGYSPALLESYRPNETFYLSREQRASLRDIGRMSQAGKSPGAYARHILEMLLIDLSWNSSRLEGNTYSRLEAELLLTLGDVAEGKNLSETQMILNHKAALEYLASGSEEIGFNLQTILSLHALLADNLLANSQAAGRLRRTSARIADSVYTPPAAPQRIEACFDRLLAVASAIEDPFEQSFFVLAQLPYLQPFDDINKRVARLSANIPLVNANLAPLTFESIVREVYDQAVLGVFELRRRRFLAEVFACAYQHSAGQNAAVRHLLGEPDPFRLKHRAALGDLMRAVVRLGLNKSQAAAHIRSNVQKHVGPKQSTRLRDIAERELLSLHPGNCARYRIRPREFAAWRQHWASQSASAAEAQFIQSAQ